MSRDDLKAKYGKNKNSNQLLNAAVRAECPGGNEALDATLGMRNLDKAIDRLPRSIKRDDFARSFRRVLVQVRQIVDAMVATIRDRYGFHEDQQQHGDGAANDPPTRAELLQAVERTARQLRVAIERKLSASSAEAECIGLEVLLEREQGGSDPVDDAPSVPPRG